MQSTPLPHYRRVVETAVIQGRAPIKFLRSEAIRTKSREIDQFFLNYGARFTIEELSIAIKFPSFSTPDDAYLHARFLARFAKWAAQR